MSEDTAAAVAAAARAALAEATSPSLALLFATPDHSAEAVVAAAQRELAALPWVAVVTPAILVGHQVMARGVAVGVIDSDRVRVGIGTAGPTSSDARAAGRAAARDALRDMPLPPEDRSRAMLLFADAGRHDAAEVLHGALSVAGAGVAWCGGGTGEPERRAQLTLFAHPSALGDHVLAVALDCQSRVGVGIKHGWQPKGPPAMVTRARGTVLEHLEHRPALETYRDAAEEIGERVDAQGFGPFASTHPLGIPQADGEYLIRDPLSVDEAGALHFLASVPDGALVRVMTGTPSMLIEAARAAATMARLDAGGALGGALVFDCISRYLMLGPRLEEELLACQEALGPEVAMLGCLTFGEVGAFGSRMPQFHNKTMVVLALPA